jgi:cell division protein FtsI/penicillin-binding protein 2
LLLILVIAFAGLIARCFYLQYYKKDYYSQKCLSQLSYQQQQSQRGSIFDTRCRLLAASNRVQNIFAEPRVLGDTDNIKEAANKLSSCINMGAHVICSLILDSKNPGYVKIVEDANSEQCREAQKVKGIGIQTDWRRTYPMGSLMAQIVGFTSKDNNGLEGIELKYDDQLRGTDLQNIFFADNRRRPIRLKEQNGKLADGVGIILTIDAAIQQLVREELAKQYEEFEAESAMAIVADPKTGAILAMVSVPDFDPNNIGASDPNNRRNRLITDQFEPGSMIKPIVTAIAIENGAIDKDDTIFCENGNYFGKSFGRINEYKNHRFGNLKIRQIIIKSSNIGMAKMGQKMGQKTLYEGLKMFGFGEKTGIELPGEVEGLLRPLSQWSGYSVTRIPYGYEINVTSMQMLQAYCILANGGRLVRPYMVKAIIDNNGDVVEMKQQTPIGYIIRPDVAKWLVTDVMVGVVEEKNDGGTGYRAALDKWQVFGKTGTANISKVGEEGYEDNANIASFIAGAPAEDPAVVVLISIRRPNGKLGKGDSGGAVASPVAGRIIDRTLTYLGIAPTKKVEKTAAKKPEKVVAKKSEKVVAKKK